MKLASVVIPTCGRMIELRQLLESLAKQTVPLEVLVMDDAGNAELELLLRNEFPEAQYHHLGSGLGPAFQRNRGIALARHEIVFPVDDDTFFPSAKTVEQTLLEFDHPRVGAVGIPYRNPSQDKLVRQQAPAADGIYVTHAFVGAAHAFRRSIFLKLEGYREHFFYMGEEGDLSLRMLAAGYVVRLGNADPIEHLESPYRDCALADRSGRRNDVLFAWHNTPSSALPLHLVATSINGILTGFRLGRPWRMFQGTLAGFAESWRRRRERAPVPMRIYELHRTLKKHGPCKLSAIESILPLSDPTRCPPAV